MPEISDFFDKRCPTDFSDRLLETAEKQSASEKVLMKCIRANELDMALRDAFSENIVASYAIENEYLDSEAVKSLVIDSMGMNVPDWDCDELKTSREALAVRATLALMDNENLSHDDIFRTYSLIRGKKACSYRNHPEIVKNGLGKTIYRAPEAAYVPELMDKFVFWWNNERKKIPPPLGAAAAHYIFVSVHPFDDGNGRIARALCDRAMISERNEIFRPYSWSSAILEKRLDYYGSLRAPTSEPFLRFMLAAHKNALKTGFQQAARFRFLERVFLCHNLDSDEKEMVREMSRYRNAKWRPDDFFRIANPEDVYLRLINKGVISENGMLASPATHQRLSGSPFLSA